MHTRYTLDREGFKVTLYTQPEIEFIDPAKEYDCYTPKQIAAYRNDEWSFAILTVTVELDDVTLAETSLGHVEDGFLPITDEDDNIVRDSEHYDAAEHADDYMDFVDEAIEQAREKLAELRSSEVR